MQPLAENTFSSNGWMSQARVVSQVCTTSDNIMDTMDLWSYDNGHIEVAKALAFPL